MKLALLLLTLPWILLVARAAFAEDQIRIGLIGLDTSHVIAFTKILNDATAPDHVPGARVVAGYPGGSPDNPASASRVKEYTQQLVREFGIEIVDDIPGLCARVDAVLLESVDGRPHLAELRPVIAARKPVFIDKPIAGSLEDAMEIARLARESGVPCFSSSSLRFYPGVARLRRSDEVGEVLGCDAYSPCSLEEHHPDLYWYGVHGVEILYTLMGTGCESVARSTAPDHDLVVGRWKDGRIGTYRGIRKGAAPFGATVFGTKGMKATEPVAGSLYRPLIEEIVKFFRTRTAPVTLEETLEIFAFMTAADASKRNGGKPVLLADVIEAARRAVGCERIEPRPERKGGTVKIAAGEIPAMDLVGFLADATGLPVVHDASGGTLAERTVLIAAAIEAASTDIVKRILEANHWRITEASTAGGERILLIEPTDAAAGVEPRERPIVVVGGPRSSRFESAQRPPSRAARGPEDDSASLAGVTFVSVPELLRSQVSLEGGGGVLVDAVEAGRAAAGGADADLATLLRRHDIVTHVDGQGVSSPRQTVERLKKAEAGGGAQLRVVRGGITRIVSLAGPAR